MKLAVPAAVAVALLTGCGSGGDGEDRAGSGRASDRADTRSRDRATFRARALGFTFEYPRDLAASRPARRARSGVADVLAQVAVADPARLNAVKVRQSGDREYRPARYVREFRRVFAREAEGEVTVRRADIGALDVTIIAFDASAPGDPPSRFTSTSHFFAGAGRTWQVECIAEEGNGDEVADVCRTVLESVRFRKRLASGQRGEARQRDAGRGKPAE